MSRTVEPAPNRGAHTRKIPFSAAAAFAGTVVALAAQVLLASLLTALGLQGAAVVMGSVVALAASLYVGGMVAGASARSVTRAAGAIEGVVVWSLAVLVAGSFLAHAGGGWASMVAVGAPMSASATGWMAFGSMALALVSAVLGGVAGASTRAHTGGRRTMVFRTRDRGEGKPSRAPARMKPSGGSRAGQG